MHQYHQSPSVFSASEENRIGAVISLGLAVILLAACSYSGERAGTQAENSSANQRPQGAAKTQAPPRDRIRLANGRKNWINVDGMERNGDVFRFAEVTIDGSGWLVMHPFEDGAPNGKIYVGATYLNDGSNQNVAVTVNPAPTSGEKYIVMLHRDVNQNQQFDFVFVDERNVLDRAVFEGNTMIAHAITAP